MSENKEPSHHGFKEVVTGQYPNETMRLLMERASCRVFSDKKIPEDTLDLILDAGIHAPTGGNLQPYSIIKIESQETSDKLAEMCGQNFIARAPVNLIFCIDWHRLERWAELEVAPFTATKAFRHFWISFQDTIICAQNICTAADAMGLGSVYVGTIMEIIPEVCRLCGLPKGVLPVVLLCLGYPGSRLMVRRKLGRRAVVHDERYHDLDDELLKAVFDEKYNYAKIDVTSARVQRIREVCEKIHGKAFAEKFIGNIENKGYISKAQGYFGLHYSADVMPDSNDGFLKIIRESGFAWFERYEPAKDKCKYDEGRKNEGTTY